MDYVFNPFVYARSVANIIIHNQRTCVDYKFGYTVNQYSDCLMERSILIINAIDDILNKNTAYLYVEMR